LCPNYGPSSEIAQLLLDPDGYESDQDTVSQKDNPDPTGVDSRAKEPESTDQDGRLMGPRNRKGRLERFNRDLASLLASDFTRDLVIIFETNSHEPSERFQWVPLRNKIDTGSDENFISHEILEKHHVKEDKIRAIPEGEQEERELAMLGGYKIKPQREITLQWYRPKDAQMRETTFIIAENKPPFDTLICKKDWDTEISRSVLVIKSRRKKKCEWSDSYLRLETFWLTSEKRSVKQRPRRKRSKNRLR
jgi:hypothetical protein